MNDTTQKISEEAAKVIAETLGLKKSQVPGLKLIIQATIEKAINQRFTLVNGIQMIRFDDTKERLYYDIDGHLIPAPPPVSRAAHASEQLYRIKEGTDLSYLPHWLIPVDEASESDLLRAASECSFEAGRGVERAAHASEQTGEP